MKFQNTETWGFEHAIKGMRNPKNSWNKSDSLFGITYIEQMEADWQVASNYVDANEKYDFDNEYDKYYEAQEKYADWLLHNGILKDQNECFSYAFIGPNDMKLAQTLINGGSEHRKFLRQIFVSVDITAPLYFFKQFDTYKIGTTANSTSTMHKLTSKPITLDCFETDDMNSDLIYYSLPEYAGGPAENDIGMLSDFIIEQLEFLRQKYLETKDKRYWKELVRWLPESWLQTRTWSANYEVLYNMVLQRGYHKLKTEWGNGFIHWCTSLPYAKDLIFYGEEREKIYNLYA